MKKYQLTINIEGTADEILEQLRDIKNEIVFLSAREPITNERILNLFGGKGWDIEELEEITH